MGVFMRPELRPFARWKHRFEQLLAEDPFREADPIVHPMEEEIQDETQPEKEPVKPGS